MQFALSDTGRILMNGYFQRDSVLQESVTSINSDKLAYNQ